MAIKKETLKKETERIHLKEKNKAKLLPQK